VASKRSLKSLNSLCCSWLTTKFYKWALLTLSELRAWIAISIFFSLSLWVYRTNVAPCKLSFRPSSRIWVVTLRHFDQAILSWYLAKTESRPVVLALRCFCNLFHALRDFQMDLMRCSRIFLIMMACIDLFALYTLLQALTVICSTLGKLTSDIYKKPLSLSILASNLTVKSSYFTC
jgi:hypothetical protein